MNEVVIFCEKDGHKRKGEKANCELCSTEFVRRLKPYPGCEKKKYCTKECSDIARQDRVTVKCEICGTQFERTKGRIKRSRNNVFFCKRECKDFAQSLEGDCKAIQPDHYGTADGIYNYREKCKKEFLNGCVGCKEKKRYKLLVHHIDGNRRNNKKSNLEVVCYNCHAVRHLRLADGVWKFLFSALTPRHMIKELT